VVVFEEKGAVHQSQQFSSKHVLDVSVRTKGATDGQVQYFLIFIDKLMLI